MARFVIGDVVVVPFPFSDLSNSKRRPALVIATLARDEVILCQITSQLNKDSYAINLSVHDFETGSLKKESNIRINRIFTADKQIIIYKIGKVNIQKIRTVKRKLADIFKI